MRRKKTDQPSRKRQARKLIHSTAAIRARVNYLCDYLFGGNVLLFAHTVCLEGTHLRLCLHHKSRLSPAMLSQIISLTNARAEWLLRGVGPMLSSDVPAGHDALALPYALGSAFSRFDNDVLPALPPAPPTRPPSAAAPGDITAAHAAAARCIALARGADKPVYVLLGKTALADGVRPVVAALLEKKYVTGVGLTSAAVELDVPTLPTTDKTHIAKLGAQSGFGFGEALCHWGHPAEDSLVRVAQRMSAPITVHPEFGEVSDHFRAGLHGAEVGAVFGAVAYVDLLIFGEAVRQFNGSPGGVCIALGDGLRLGNLFAQAIQVCRQIAPAAYRDFAFVLIDSDPVSDLERLLGCNNEQVHFIQGAIASNAAGLAKACDAVFDGTI